MTLRADRLRRNAKSTAALTQGAATAQPRGTDAIVIATLDLSGTAHWDDDGGSAATLLAGETTALSKDSHREK